MGEPFAAGSDSRAAARLHDRYRLGARVGGGGMAIVYQGWDERLARTVAIKLLDPTRYGRPDARVRFEREARAAAAISHPNVVAVHDVGSEGDVVYIVMECLPGTTLGDEIATRRLSAERTVAVLRDVLAGLGAAHDRQILHRDVKPSNVLLTAEGRAKLADFGIASSGAHDLTETGVVVGTASYLAPERVAGEPATVQSDLYSVGVVAYEALTGTRPFAGDTPLAIAQSIQSGHTPALRDVRPELPGALCEAIAQSMAVRPEARPTSARDFLRRLDTAATMTADTIATPAVSTAPMPAAAPGVTRSEPRRSRRRPVAAALLALAAVVALAAATLAVVAAVRDDETEPPASPASTAPSPSLPGGLDDAFEQLEEAVRP